MNEQLALLGQLVLGLTTQWFLRGPAKIPTWLAWVGTAAVSIGVYVWITPDVAKSFAANWREGLAGLVTFLLATRGGGATAKDAKLAPASNSL